MTIKPAWGLAIFTALSVLARMPPASAAEPPIDRAALDALVQPVVNDGWLYGVAIGVVDERGSAVFGYGHISQADPRPPDGETVFELASISKVFTGLLLAQLVEAGDVRLDTPVRELLPLGIAVPDYEGREITLVDLATHSSGLPRLPSNLKFTDPADPYADYTVENMYEFLAQHKLARSPGAESEYSNLGVGLLGHVLALREKMSYEDLLIARVARPLGMKSIRVALDDSMRRRLAEPHDADGNVVKNWDIPTFAGGGGLRSTVDDMLRFMAAHLGLTETPLAAPMKLSRDVHFDNPGGVTGIGLGWQVNKREGLVWHNGATGGYRTYLALRQEKRAGVIVLATTSADNVVDPLGHCILTLLTGGHPKPLKLPHPIDLDAETRQQIVGTYRSGPRGAMTVEDGEGGLTVKFRRQPPRKLLAESRDKFFLRSGGTIELVRDDDRVTGAKIDLPGRKMEAVKQPAEN